MTASTETPLGNCSDNGITEQFINMIRNSYKGMTFMELSMEDNSCSFQVKTGIRQDCLLSPFLFLLAIVWIMKTTTALRGNGNQWTLMTQLDNLDFTNNLALLSHSQQQMQEKTRILTDTSSQVGLNINKRKTKVLKVNTTHEGPVTLEGTALE